MADVKIQALDNGSNLISGDVDILDGANNSIPKPRTCCFM